MMDRLNRALYGENVEHIPGRILVAAILAEFFNSMITTSVFTYLPTLVKDFGVPEKEIAIYVGFIASSQNFAAVIFSFIVGFLSDRFYKKYVFIASCLLSALATLGFGFSTSIPMAVIFRFMQGMSGILVVSQAMLFEICSNRNKAIAMSLSLSAYSAGLVVGPGIGGYLSFPVEKYSFLKNNSFLEKYKILLPNLLFSGLFVGLSIGAVFIHPNRYKRVYGEDESNQETCEKEHLIDRKSQENTVSLKKTTNSLSTREQFVAIARNKNCLLACSCYGMFGFFIVGFNELYPVWASTSKFYNGLQLNTNQIAKTYIGAAIFLIFIQGFLLSKVTITFGPKKVFLGGVTMQSITYTLYPGLSSATNMVVLMVMLCILNLITRISVGASFVGIVVMVNSSVSADYIGKVNGIAVGLFKLSSVIAPIAVGQIYAWSLKNIKSSTRKNALGFPFDQYFSFFLLSLMCIITIVLATFLKYPKT